MFQKKGVNKESGKYIYPELTQTTTGNCAAYAGAACLYAFGLDHEAGLIPTVNGGSADAQFQAKTARMVEKLTQLIYTDGHGTAEGYRKYIEKAGLKDKFEVTEATGGSYTLPDGNTRSNWEFMKDELRRCQDVMMHIKWSKGACKKDARHSVTLTGFDEAKKKIRGMNPWGEPYGTTNVPPDEVGRNLDAGRSKRAHTDYDMSMDGDTVKLDFHGNKAEIYEYVKICPVASPAASATSTSSSSTTPPPTSMPTRRYAYTLQNNTFHHATRFGIKIPNLVPQDVYRIFTPTGWSGSIWYRGHTPHFNLLAPEQIELEDRDADILGILYTADKPMEMDSAVKGFGFELLEPRVNLESLIALVHELFGESPDIKNALVKSEKLLNMRGKWEDVEGGAVLASEFEQGTHAVHFDVAVPRKQCEVGDLLDRFLKLQGFADRP